jgi:hypothetical protein
MNEETSLCGFMIKNFSMCDGSWSKQEGLKSAQVLETQMDGFNISRSFILEMWMQLEGSTSLFLETRKQLEVLEAFDNFWGLEKEVRR